VQYQQQMRTFGLVQHYRNRQLLWEPQQRRFLFPFLFLFLFLFLLFFASLSQLSWYPLFQLSWYPLFQISWYLLFQLLDSRLLEKWMYHPSLVENGVCHPFFCASAGASPFDFFFFTTFFFPPPLPAAFPFFGEDIDDYYVSRIR